MSALETLRSALPEYAKDVRLNLQAVLAGGTLSESQRWGVALAAAAASRNAKVRAAVLEEAGRLAGSQVVEDALAAATLMAMNNVYYRFRHLIGKAAYAEKPARLRMNRLAKPSTNRVDFELFSLAVSAINGCQNCLLAHEKAVLDGGLSEDHVHDAVRIAATVYAVALADDLAGEQTPEPAARAISA